MKNYDMTIEQNDAVLTEDMNEAVMMGGKCFGAAFGVKIKAIIKKDDDGYISVEYLTNPTLTVDPEDGDICTEGVDGNLS